MSVNSRLKIHLDYRSKEAFYRQKNPESSCVRKVLTSDILGTSMNGDRKIMQSIRIMSRPSLRKKEMEPVEPVLKNIYQSNTYRKDLSWSHFKPLELLLLDCIAILQITLSGRSLMYSRKV